MIQTQLRVNNRTGLHARPAKLFTAEAKKFTCNIYIEKNGDKTVTYNAKSIFSVLSMGADKGTVLTVYANGTDEEEAIKALSELADGNFGETEESI
ncbi:MAG: HPr family phosphocarrier protein [Clostridia bacterium]|nr:HPr family phosphocarrier protein [Clostridia bacterium]